VVVYTARLNKENNNQLEWALHQFTSAGTIKRLRVGWLYLPEQQNMALYSPQSLTQSRVILGINYTASQRAYIIHSVASPGRGSMPQHQFNISNKCIPISLLKEGLECPQNLNALVYSDNLYDSNQFLQVPGATEYKHIIGSLYIVKATNSNKRSILLVDIDFKKVLRELNGLYGFKGITIFLMIGTMSYTIKDDTMILHEYGAL
jgi:hypothetical protein